MSESIDTVTATPQTPEQLSVDSVWRELEGKAAAQGANDAPQALFTAKTTVGKQEVVYILGYAQGKPHLLDSTGTHPQMPIGADTIVMLANCVFRRYDPLVAATRAAMTRAEREITPKPKRAPRAKPSRPAVKAALGSPTESGTTHTPSQPPTETKALPNPPATTTPEPTTPPPPSKPEVVRSTELKFMHACLAAAGKVEHILPCVIATASTPHVTTHVGVRKFLKARPQFVFFNKEGGVIRALSTAELDEYTITLLTEAQIPESSRENWKALTQAAKANTAAE